MTKEERETDRAVIAAASTVVFAMEASVRWPAALDALEEHDKRMADLASEAAHRLSHDANDADRIFVDGMRYAQNIMAHGLDKARRILRGES